MREPFLHEVGEGVAVADPPLPLDGPIRGNQKKRGCRRSLDVREPDNANSRDAGIWIVEGSGKPNHVAHGKLILTQAETSQHLLA